MILEKTITFNKFFKITYTFKRMHIEAWFWITAIILLIISNPSSNHVSLCMFKNLNLGFCPGCGLGHSISWLFRGEFINSFQAHPLGLPAVIILLYRSFKLLKNDLKIVLS